MAGNLKAKLSDKESSLYKEVLTTANEQLNKIGKIMPEGVGALQKYPGMNPIGFYSEIDMGFSERMKRCENAVRLKDFLVWTEYTNLKKRIEEHPAYGQMKKDMVETSKKMRVVDRALRLCKDENVRKALEETKEELSNAPVLKEFDTLMKTFEAYSGVKLVHRDMGKNIDAKNKYQFEMRKLCHDKFGINVGECSGYEPYKQTNRFVNPKSLEVEFENIADIMQCHRMVSDQNMGKSLEEVKRTPTKRDDLKIYGSAVPAYLQASCDRVLDSALPDVKDRADYILINGVSVREKMKKLEGIKNPSEEQIKKYSSLYVAAALRQGQHVETFTKDITVDGTFINYKPVPIVAKGEDSSILKQKGENEFENITVSILDRILALLGFTDYKEKVEKAKIKEGREAFRKAHTPRNSKEEKKMINQTMKAPINEKEAKQKKETFEVLKKHKDDFMALREDNLNFAVKRNLLHQQFFPNGTKEIKNEATGLTVPGHRETQFTLAMVKMLDRGYSLEQVLDVSKYADIREKMGQEISKELRTCDEKTFFEKHLEVTDKLDKHFEKFAKDHNVSFKNPSSVYKEGVLLEIALGAGNVPDIIMQKGNKEKVEKYFGEGIVEITTEKTDASIINSKVVDDRDKLMGFYKTIADGQYPSINDFHRLMKGAITFGLFAKMEQQTGKVYAHPIALHELLQIENAVLAHPNVEKFYKETPKDKLVEIIAQEKLLEAMNIDFEILPTKQVPGRDLQSEAFSVNVELGMAVPVNYVPTFNGKSDFYKMVTPEKAMEMMVEREQEMAKQKEEMENEGMNL